MNKLDVQMHLQDGTHLCEGDLTIHGMVPGKSLHPDFVGNEPNNNTLAGLLIG